MFKTWKLCNKKVKSLSFRLSLSWAMVTFTEEIFNGKLHFLCSTSLLFRPYFFRLRHVYVKERNQRTRIGTPYSSWRDTMFDVALVNKDCRKKKNISNNIIENSTCKELFEIKFDSKLEAQMEDLWKKASR